MTKEYSRRDFLGTGLKAVLGLATVTIGVGCKRQEEQYVEAIVTREFGTATHIVESSGAMFGNESVKFRYPTYGIQFKIGEDVYTASIKSSIHESLESLAVAIDEGTKIQIKERLLKSQFDKGRVGFLDAYDFHIVT